MYRCVNVYLYVYMYTYIYIYSSLAGLRPRATVGPEAAALAVADFQRSD